MFSESERKLLKISRALVSLRGFFIVDQEYNVIDDPIILINLLNNIELESFKNIYDLNPVEKLNIENSIVRDKVLSILGYDKQINLDYTPAGVITSIAAAVIKKSEEYLLNTDNKMYEEAVSGVNYIEQMCAIISYYTNTTYDVVIEYPINEIYKRYAICQTAFPNQIQALSPEE